MTERERLIVLVKDIAEDMVAVCGDSCDDCKHGDCVGKLADHLLANGVIVPPCKVGDTVYELVNWCDYTDCHFEGCAGCSHCNEKGIVERKFNHSHLGQIGKTVFLTKEDAEKALNERSEKNG